MTLFEEAVYGPVRLTRLDEHGEPVGPSVSFELRDVDDKLVSILLGEPEPVCSAGRRLDAVRRRWPVLAAALLVGYVLW